MKYECKYCLYKCSDVEYAICKCPKCNKIIISQLTELRQIHEILRDIVVALGVQVLSDKVRMFGLLMDLKVNNKIRNIVLFAIRENIHGKLLINKNDDIRIESIKYFFSIQNFLHKEIADYIVDSFAYAIGTVNSIDISKIKNEWFTDNVDIKNFSEYEIIKPVTISKFGLIDDKVIEDHSFFIEYETLNAKSVYINKEEVYEKNGKYNAKISGYKKFELIAENEHYKDCRELEITPIKKPHITEFKINAIYIKSGDEVILSWNVENAFKIILKYDNEEIDVTSICELKITQKNNTRYILQAYTIDELYSVSEVRDVIVVNPVQIHFFRTNKQRIFESEKIVLSWEVDNATKVLLMPNKKDVTIMTQVEVFPEKSGFYCLQASNELFIEENNVFIGVSKLPVIEKISFPELPDLNLKLPDLKIDMKFRSSILNQIKRAEWYNIILSLQFREMYFMIDRVINRINRKYKNIINQFNYE